jgi:thioesterase domain-containing protein
MARIEKRLGKLLPIASLFATPSLESLAAALSESGSRSIGRQGRSPLVAIKPQGDAPPFFCVHPVGGNVLCYLSLSRHLSPDQPFYALQSPDPGEAAALPASVEEMATRYLRELRRVQPEGPYRLGGWSMGGLVAFEMARQLEGAGEEVDLVAVIDTPPPAADPRPPASDDELVAGFAEDLARLLGHDVAIAPEDLAGSTAAEKLDRVTELAHEAGLLPKDFGAAQLRPLFAIYAANLQASRAYARQTYSGSVTLYLATATVAMFGPEMLDGWRRAALGGVETTTLPGDHYSLVLGAEVERLAMELNGRLAVEAKRLVS